MKLKKLVSAVACVVMAGVFATSAFALDATQVTPDQIKEAQNFLDTKGIYWQLTNEDYATIYNAFGGDPAAAESKANEMISKVKADPNNAATYITETMKNEFGVTLSDVKITVNADGTVTGSATLSNGRVISAGFTGATVAASSEHPEIGANKDENGNWHVDEATTDAAASVTTTAGSVIKATGDNSAVVLVAGVLAVTTVLGLAVRKNSNIG